MRNGCWREYLISCKNICKILILSGAVCQGFSDLVLIAKKIFDGKVNICVHVRMSNSRAGQSALKLPVLGCDDLTVLGRIS